MTFASLTRRRGLALAAVALALAAAGAVGIAIGSDHQDTPLVELNPETDMTDVYAFPGSAAGRIVLVMNSRAFLTPAQAAGPPSFDEPVVPVQDRQRLVTRGRTRSSR